MNLESFLEVEEGGVLESGVADQVVKLVAGFNDVQVADVFNRDHVLLL